MLNPKYVSIQTAHRYFNEIEGLRIGLNSLYEKVRSGEIRSIFVAGKYQIVASELLDYPERLLLESRGIAPIHKGLLGQPKTLNE